MTNFDRLKASVIQVCALAHKKSLSTYEAKQKKSYENYLLKENSQEFFLFECLEV